VGLAVMPVGTAGQTATGVLWVKDDVAGVWLKWQDVTTTFGNEPFFIPAPPNAKMHLQVTAGNLSAVVIGLFPYASSQVDIGAIAVEAPAPAMTTLRTLVAAVADVEPPVDGSAWVTVPGSAYAPFLHIPIAGAITDLGGTVPASEVTVRVWTRLGAGGAINKVHDQTFNGSLLKLSEALNPYRPIHVPINAPDVLVTITFPDGTAPTITGTLKGRMVAEASATSRDFPIDPITRALLVRLLGYDSAADAIKNMPGVFESEFALTESKIFDQTGVAFGTPLYAPNTDGKILIPHDSISFQYSLAAAGGGTISTWWEVANADVWTLASDITLSAFNLITKATPLASPITSAVNGTLTGFVQFDNINAMRIRQAILPNTANSGACLINSRTKVRGS
jgi:hypothetical protein